MGQLWVALQGRILLLTQWDLQLQLDNYRAVIIITPAVAAAVTAFQAQAV